MLATILTLLYTLVVILIIGVIIGENRSPIRALPWILVVILIPVLGIIAYFVLGTNLRYKQLISFKRYVRLAFTYENITSQGELPEGATPWEQDLVSLAFHSSHSSAQRAHTTIYTSGTDYFEALTGAILNAHHHIHIQYYEIKEGNIADRLTLLLLQVVQKGVRVRLIYDDVGSRSTSRAFWKRLKNGGVEVYPFMRVYFPFLTQKVNYRNHKRIIVVDGWQAFVGSTDFKDNFFPSTDSQSLSGIQVGLSGRAVYQVQRSFLIDWHIVSKQMIEGKEYYPELLPRDLSTTPTQAHTVQILSTSPYFQWNCVEQVFCHLFQRAQRSIRIEAPVYLPTDAIHQSLLSAALSGVEVYIILPKHRKYSISSYASQSYFSELADAGIHILRLPLDDRYAQHITIDDRIVLLGSSRLDFRCFENNFELNALLYDPELAHSIGRHFDATRSISTPVEALTQESAPKIQVFFQQFVERFFRLFSPLL